MPASAPAAGGPVVLLWNHRVAPQDGDESRDALDSHLLQSDKVRSLDETRRFEGGRIEGRLDRV
ncbi:MAG: hypothetical protein OYL41_15260 [Acidobacteriota bacterium]|nr:hypothetical protein [Acidobacteriota bacterium]